MFLDLRVPILPTSKPRPRVRSRPKGALTIRSGEEEAKAFGKELERGRLAHFCIEPHTRWPMHRHESEELTLVLAGELFFDLGNEVIAVKEHEAITIPSWTPHAKFTGGKCAVAVDAWSQERGQVSSNMKATVCS